MRALALCLVATFASTAVQAQQKAAPKGGGTEVRYFTSIDGLMEGNADVILKEVRQGKTVTSATLDICYPASPGSQRKDRFTADLMIAGQTYTGNSRSQVDKLPVAVKLNRKTTGEHTDFKGQITIGQTSSEVNSTDNSDISESEFEESRGTGTIIAEDPKDFTEVSPESVAARIKLDAVADVMKSLRGQNVELSLIGLATTCEALRSGEQLVMMSVDPDRAAEFVTKLKAMPGVVSAGWISGLVDMERTVRFPAAEWSTGGRLNREKIGAAIADALKSSFKASAAATRWDEATGKLTVTLRRPYEALPGLGLTEKLEINALAFPERSGALDSALVWVSTPTTEVVDESGGPKLILSDSSSSDEEGEFVDDEGSVGSLARAFRAQRWNGETGTWK